MGNKYGWYCKHCGAFMNSNSRSKVEAFKKYHKNNNHRCALRVTKGDTLARPSLAKHLDDTKYKYTIKRPRLF
jgi:hypothetical protein